MQQSPVHVLCRCQLAEAEEQSSELAEQQEGAEELVHALRQELHNLRQDTNSVAANARHTLSEKEALQVHFFPILQDPSRYTNGLMSVLVVDASMHWCKLCDISCCYPAALLERFALLCLIL